MQKISPVGIAAFSLLGVLLKGTCPLAQPPTGTCAFAGVAGTSYGARVFESTGRPERLVRVVDAAADVVPPRLAGASAARDIEFAAGGDDLRSFLTLPSVADPNSITPRPFFSPSESRVMPPVAGGLGSSAPIARQSRAGAIGQPDRGQRSLHVTIRPVTWPRVKRPHLWAGLGTILGGLANVHLSGYRLADFKLRVNPWESERIAMREQGADMVQHFILGYGLTRYFLDNGSTPVAAGASAFVYEFMVGEVFESFPQAGGISWRDVVFDVIAVTVGAVDHQFDSPIRFRATSRIDARLSAPSEFDPYHFSLGVALTRFAGLEVIAAVQSWKDHLPTAADLRVDPLATTTYTFANY